jgi:glycosyltransferase involved in cell wall biosynthesis
MSSRRLQILQVFNRYLQYGGEEGSITRIGDALQDIHDVDYFFYSTSQLTGHGLLGKLKMPWKTFRNSEVAAGLKRMQLAKRFDAWQIHNVFPAMSPVVYEIALKQKTPIVHYLHNYRLSCVNGFFLNHGQPCQRCFSGDFWPAFETACWRESRLQSGWMGLITNRIRRMPLFEKVFRWVAISAAQKEVYVRMGIPADKIKVIHHFLQPTPEPLPPSHSPTAIFVGRLSQEKGVENLLQAWKQVAGGERKLLIMGDGPERPKLEHLAKGLHGVEFLGFRKKEDQQRYWKEALFSVVPSIWMEPFGMTVLESWSNGRPVVAHAIGALPELIREGIDGALADPNSIDNLASKLDLMLSNPKQTAAMGLAGRDRLEDYFSRRRWLKEIAVIYEDLQLTL